MITSMFAAQSRTRTANLRVKLANTKKEGRNTSQYFAATRWTRGGEVHLAAAVAVEEVVAMVVAKDFIQRSGGNGRRGGGNNGKSKDDRIICRICGKPGHPAWKCWHRYSRNNEEEEMGANAAYGVDTNWNCDTSATDHITSELDKLAMKERYNGLTTGSSSRRWKIRRPLALKRSQMDVVKILGKQHGTQPEDDSLRSARIGNARSVGCEARTARHHVVPPHADQQGGATSCLLIHRRASSSEEAASRHGTPMERLPLVGAGPRP
ncbi:hypothetical protein QYE76_054310 [Lolium multiflorum]|uniref:CCHC-type domain-containing protein n=1 Tax=Lolium multiflorum TaxID=4521 RepID=A0AAD8SXG1_LOLMU|nr:hypothetical protein QYE76_054310 [Lolium multiflorum]